MTHLESTWFDVQSGPFTFHVSADALKDGHGLRVTFNPLELDTYCKEMCCVAPTPYLLDLRYKQSGCHNLPCPKYYPKGKGMRTIEAIREHNARIEKSLIGVPCSGPIGNVGKHWVYPLEKERLYGWHVETAADTWEGIPLHPSIVDPVRLKVIQSLSRFHSGKDPDKVEPTHDDYAMTGVVVYGTCLEGCKVPTLDVYRSKSPWVFGR